MKRIFFLIGMCYALSANAQTTAEVERELYRQRVPHAEIVLAQARLETGNFTSRRCREDKNLFGIKHSRRYARYKRWQDSVADYKERISSRYKGGSYHVFLRKIGYAEEKEYIQKVRRIVNGMARH